MIFLCRALAVTPRLTLLIAGLSVLQSITLPRRPSYLRPYGISRRSIRCPGLLTTNLSSPAALAAFDFRVLRWLMLPLRRVNFPLPVTRNRRAAPLCVFSFGISCLCLPALSSTLCVRRRRFCRFERGGHRRLRASVAARCRDVVRRSRRPLRLWLRRRLRRHRHQDHVHEAPLHRG